MRAARRAGEAGDQPEDRREPVVGAIDDPRDPAARPAMPALASEDPGEPNLRALRACTALDRRHAPGAQLRERDGVLLLLVANLPEQHVGVRVAGRALLDLGRDLLLHRLLACEQAIDRRQACLQTPPRRE